MPSVKLAVAGLQSPTDEARLQRALEAEPGIFGAVANHRDGCAEIDFEDDEVAIERMLEVVRAAGFDAQLAG